MRLGLDTCFLVAHEVKDHPRYADSRALFRQCVSNGDDFALAPQVLAELVHVLTDQRRFNPPLTMVEALQRAQMWWNAVEVTQVFPTDAAVNKFECSAQKPPSLCCGEHDDSGVGFRRAGIRHRSTVL
jgi:predicted nucleic acid-binding protein